MAGGLGKYTRRGDATARRQLVRTRCLSLIGNLPVNSVRPPDILDVMHRMQARGIIDSMRRVLAYVSKVFELAMVKELVERDPTTGIAAQLQQRTEGHFAAITKPVEVGALLRAIHGYQATSIAGRRSSWRRWCSSVPTCYAMRNGRKSTWKPPSGVSRPRK